MLGSSLTTDYRSHLLWLPEQWAQLQSLIQGAQVAGGVAVHTVGVVPGADQQGAQQQAEVKAVPSLVFQDGGWGVERTGLERERSTLSCEGETCTRQRAGEREGTAHIPGLCTDRESGV